MHALTMPLPEGDSLKVLFLRELQPLRVGQAVKLRTELLNVPGGQVIELVDLETREILGSHRLEEARERLAMEFEFEPDRSGFLPLALRAGEKSLERTFAVEDPLGVLYLGERVVGGADRLEDLLGKGVTLSVVEPGPRTSPDLEAFDLVMADDYPASQWPPAERERLLESVREEGLGLVMAGGMAAFGPGGYGDTELAAALPVEFMQKEEKRDPSTTLAVIIDTSGSMGGERVQLAKEVARLAIRRLLPHDKVGIVEFYGTKQWAAPIQSAANAIDIQRALNRLDAGGGTVIMPAIEEAYYAMQNVQTRYKHVLVLTDGGVEADEFEPLLRKMAAKGINVSTVLVGGDTHSEFLVNIANWGKGHFYSASNRFSIPEILLKQPSTSKIPAYRPGDHALTGRGGPGWWGPVDATDVPALRGYVETRARDEAEMLLETTEQRHPVLATWKFGMGRVTALMTEPVGPGTRDWLDWDGYGPWLARVLARTAREERSPFQFEAERRGVEVTVRARKMVSGEREPLVERLGESPVEIPLERRSPEWWTAELVVDPAEEARFLGSVLGGGYAPVPFLSNDRDDVTPVEHFDPENAADLTRMAASTQGGVFDFQGLTEYRPVAGVETHPGKWRDCGDGVSCWPCYVMLPTCSTGVGPLENLYHDCTYSPWPLLFLAADRLSSPGGSRGRFRASVEGAGSRRSVDDNDVARGGRRLACLPGRAGRDGRIGGCSGRVGNGGVGGGALVESATGLAIRIAARGSGGL